MLNKVETGPFPRLNRAYNSVFNADKLSVGLVVPLENHAQSAVPTMTKHLQMAQLADRLGFSALWLRDVPFNVSTFGDAGQIFDPFVYLGALAVSTQDIALGVASIVLPLRHPVHVAKAAASADVLSGGRLLLGVASGDRPEEYPALNVTFPDRGARFRESMDYLRAAASSHPRFENGYGNLGGDLDLLPKPVAGRLPLIITGGSQQSPDWVARHGDGWMTYPRNVSEQRALVAKYRQQVEDTGLQAKPVMQSLYVNLVKQPDAAPQPIHLGFRSGVDFLKRYLSEIRASGINHVALNLRFNTENIELTMQRLADEILPEFN